MKDLVQARITIIWLFLGLLTCISWLLADNFSISVDGTHKWITATLMSLAFLKVRLVIMHFMEVSHAPTSLLCLFEVWSIVVCLSILVLYFKVF